MQFIKKTSIKNIPSLLFPPVLLCPLIPLPLSFWYTFPIDIILNVFQVVYGIGRCFVFFQHSRLDADIQGLGLITLMSNEKWCGKDITKSSPDVVYPWCLARFMTLGQHRADFNPATNHLSNYKSVTIICQPLAQHWPHNTSPIINIWCWTTVDQI